MVHFTGFHRGTHEKVSQWKIRRTSTRGGSAGGRRGSSIYKYDKEKPLSHNDMWTAYLNNSEHLQYTKHNAMWIKVMPTWFMGYMTAQSSAPSDDVRTPQDDMNSTKPAQHYSTITFNDGSRFFSIPNRQYLQDRARFNGSVFSPKISEYLWKMLVLPEMLERTFKLLIGQTNRSA